VSVVVIGQPSLLVGRLPRGRVVLGHRGTDCWRGPSRAPGDPGRPVVGSFAAGPAGTCRAGAAKTPEQTVEIAEVLTVVAQDPSRRKPIDR
jgi:hypothetical protein